MVSFEVIDPETGEYPNLEHIARTEEWAQNLIPCDVDGFCINEDENLLLMDECGNYAYCPPDRFQVNLEFPVHSRERKNCSPCCAGWAVCTRAAVQPAPLTSWIFLT